MYVKQTTQIPRLLFHITEGATFKMETLVLSQNKVHDFSMKSSYL